MRKSVTALAVLALGAMVAVGSATESMAHGGGGGGHGGGGHGGGGSHSEDSGGGHGGHGFGGGGRGFGGRGDHGFGRGFGGGDNSFGGFRGVSHNRFGDHIEHFRNFPRDDNYGFYSCEYPFRWNSPFDYCQ